MLLTDFNFELPESLIAQTPSKVRGDDKLMALNRLTGEVSDHKMCDLVNLIAPGSLMIFNNSRVRRARVFAKKATSDKAVEFVFLSPVIKATPSLGNICNTCNTAKTNTQKKDIGESHTSANSLIITTKTNTKEVTNKSKKGANESKESLSATIGKKSENFCKSGAGFGKESLGTAGNSALTADWEVLTGGAKHQKVGHTYTFCDGRVATLTEKRSDGVAILHFDEAIGEYWFEKVGHVPLPPYIKRADNSEDSERYQTVYAKNIGSVACPTAGLHFTQKMMEALSARGVDVDYITLHVGLGTFLPVREKVIEAHKMHSELYTISADVAKKINDAKKAGRHIIAVGTTVMRTLEAAASEKVLGAGGVVSAGTRATNIFIYPPYNFKVVDELFTNFHTPESTLLMLVSAFAGRENILKAYEEAVKKQYRFFSYGDAMIIQ